MIPASSARRIASLVSLSTSISLAASSSVSASSASGTDRRRRLVLRPPCGSMSRRFSTISSMPVPEKTSITDWASRRCRSRPSDRRASPRAACAAGSRAWRCRVAGPGRRRRRGRSRTSRVADGGHGDRRRRARSGRPRAARGGNRTSSRRSSAFSRARGRSPLALLLAQHRDRRLGQIAHHRVHVAAHVAHLGEL